MAPIVMVQSDRTAYQALIELEKSHAPFSEQILEAARIIKVDLDAFSSRSSSGGLEGTVKRGILFSGKEEWVLRWLLKRLETQGNCARLDPQAWVLMRHLLGRIPVVNAARLLSAHDFLQLLETSLEGGLTQAHEQGVLSTGDSKGSIDISDESGSSSTLVDNTTSTSPKQSKKRKRPGASVQGDSRTSFSDSCKPKMDILFCAIVGSFNQLVDMIAEPKSGEEDFEGQYIIAVLRSSPDRAASILRSALRTAAYLIRDEKFTGAAISNDSISPIAPFAVVWEHRSVNTDDLSGRASNEAFSSFCLIPALTLLSTCNESPHKLPWVKHTVTMLEQLLARHIILPSRSMFLAAREQLGPNPSSDNTPLSLLDPLNRIDLSTVPNSAPTSEDKLDRRALSAIPMIFDVAIRCLPRDTPRKKVNEAPWLETMFLRLTNQLSEIAKDMNQRSLEMLEHMLQTAIDRKVSLDTTVLRDIITYFDVFKDGPLGCSWTLVAKILELDANVFLMPTDGYHSHTGSSPSTNGLLDTLFSHITTGARTVPHKHSEDYRLIKSRIVLPLVRELAQARDLSGFLHYWRKELITLEESLTGSTTRDLSVWEDLDLANELRGLVESSLTLGQINTALSWALPDLKTFAERGSKEFSGAYASSIILDAILSAIQRDETTDSVSRIVQSIGQAITALTYPDSAWPYDHRWRLWRIATLINVQWPHAWSFFSAMNNGDSRVDGSPGGSRALGAFSGLILSDSGLEGMSGRRLEGLYSFQSILGLAFVEAGDRNMSAKPLESIDLAFSAIVPLLAHAIIQARHGAKASEFQWNGRPESVISSQIVIVALAISILRYPQSLVYAKPTTRFNVLQKLYWLAEWQESTLNEVGNTVHEKPLVGVWEGLLEYEDILNHPLVLGDFMEIQIAALDSENEGKPSTPNSDGFPNFAIRMLMTLPLGVFQRHHREKILDSVLQKCLNSRHVSKRPSIAVYTALMARLMEVPNASSTLATDPAALWDLANVFGEDGVVTDTKDIYAFEELVKQTLRHLISTKDQDRSRKYLKSFHERLAGYLAQDSSNMEKCGTPHLVKTSLALFWIHRENLSKPLTEKEITRLRRLHLNHLISDLKELDTTPTGLADQSSQLDLLATLDGMMEYQDLLTSDERKPGINSTLNAIIAALTPASNVMDDPIFDVALDRTTSQALPLMYRLLFYTQERHEIGSVNVELLLRFLKLTMPEDQQRLLVTFRDLVTTLSAERRMELLSEDVHERKIGRNTNQLRVLAVLLGTIEDPGNHPKECTKVISTIPVNLSGSLWQTPDYRRFRLIAQCMRLIIQQKPWAMTQWGTDTALSAITIVVSPSGPQLPPHHAAAIYQDLCGLMGSMLSVHRKKLGGRYHLIIPLLQGMLRSLFVPDSRRGRSSKTTSLPPWLSDKGAHLDASSAAAYARLLTTICEPSVSSVTRSKNRSREELNDETKKVRATAGQYLPYLIMEYTQCQLDARISPEVKAALMPGLYAVFNVMAQETMRTLNAAMDSSCRAIFKTLYDDYRRFGKWDQT